MTSQRRGVTTLAVGIALGLIGSVVAQDQTPDPRSPLELCQVELAAVRGQLVNVDERANTLQTLLNRAAVEREQQQVAAAIEVAHVGCTLDWSVGGVLVCEPEGDPPPEDVEPEKD